MSVLQRESALQEANRVRLARADLKRRIRNGSRRVPDVLTGDVPDWLERMTTSELLSTIPYLPKKRIYEFLYTAELSEARTIGKTTLRQRNLLASLVAQWEEKRREKGKRARSHKTSAGLRRSKKGLS